MFTQFSRFPFAALFFLALSSPLLQANPPAPAEGAGSGGGGDASERRVSEIRADILKWISEGGAGDLTFPTGITLETYEREMIKVLFPQAVVLSFVTSAQEAASSDSEQKVVVGGQPKTCRGFVSTSDSLPHILCNIERFAATKDAEQYRLVHHEYAGLAGVEQNLGAASDYAISDQLSEFLIPETVLRLAVKKRVTKAKAGISHIFRSYKLVTDLGGEKPCPSTLTLLDSGAHVQIGTYDTYNKDVKQVDWRTLPDGMGSVAQKTEYFELANTQATAVLKLDAVRLLNWGNNSFERAFNKDMVQHRNSFHITLNKKTGLLTFFKKSEPFYTGVKPWMTTTQSCLMEVEN